MTVMLPAMSTVAIEKLSTDEQESGKPMPSFNHGAIQANLIGRITILTVDGKEEVLHAGVAKDPVTGLTADLAAVFS